MAGLRQFVVQLLGLGLAVVISVLISHQPGAGAQADAFLLGRRLVTGLQELMTQVLVLVFIPMLALRPGKEAMVRLASQAALLGMLGAALFWGGAACIVEVIAPDMSQGKMLARDVIRIFGLSLPFALVAVVLSSGLNLQQKFALPALLRLFPRIGVMLAFAGLAVAPVLPATWAYVGGSALALLGLVLLRPLPKQASTTNGPRPNVVAALVLVLGGQVALWLETAFAARTGLGGVTILELSQRMAALLGNTLALALIMPLFARWAANPDRRSRDNTWAVIIVAGGILILPQGVLAVVAPSVIHDLIGLGAFDAMAEMTPLYWVMLLAPFATLLSRVFLVYRLTCPEQAHNPMPVVLAMLADVVVRIVCGVVLVPVMGIEAIGLGMVLGPLASAGVLWMPCNAAMPSRVLGVPLAASVGVGVAALVYVVIGNAGWLPDGTMEGALLLITLSGLAAAAVFLALLFRFKVFGLLKEVL